MNRNLVRCIRPFTWIWLCSLVPHSRAEFVIADFNGRGFDWQCCGFDQDLASDSVTLSSSNGWGVADVRTGGIDLSNLGGDRFQIRLRTNVLNTAEEISLGLVDRSGNEAKWWFDVEAQVNPGSWTTLTSTETINSPNHGTGDWRNIDLTDITSARVLGHWQHPGPFDMSIDHITITRAKAYPGAEVDAEWRQIANDRIDQHRKSDLEVSVTDRLGNPLSDVSVEIEMQRHEFGFGSAVQAHRLRSAGVGNNREYRETIEQNFNVATIENNLKWPAWEGEWGSNFTQSGAKRAINWLADRDIEVRGHTLVWPGENHVSRDVRSLLGNVPLSTAQQNHLRQSINLHIQDVAGEVAGSITAWDVVNEPRANHDVMDALDIGDLAMVEWFEEASRTDPNAKLFLNDYGILTSGNVDSPNQRQYFETIRFLQEQGAPIDGIGFQSHFTETSLTGPEQVWQILDRFSELGLDMQITEFDFTTDDERLQSAYTRDFMTAVFAHPGVDDFVFWGFYEDAHWRPNAALFRSDWSIKPNGEAFRSLVFDEWWTDELVTTDEEGLVELRAFKGDYRIAASFGGEAVELLTVVAGQNSAAELRLDMLAPGVGDFNDDGLIDVEDIDLLTEQVVQQRTDMKFDLTGDSIVDRTDHTTLVREILDALPGDTDLNGEVRFDDFSQFTSHYGREGGWAQGDFDGDGQVQFSDFAALARNFGRVQASMVPEPPASNLLLPLLLMVNSIRRR